MVSVTTTARALLCSVELCLGSLADGSPYAVKPLRRAARPPQVVSIISQSHRKSFAIGPSKRNAAKLLRAEPAAHPQMSSVSP